MVCVSTILTKNLSIWQTIQEKRNRMQGVLASNPGNKPIKEERKKVQIRIQAAAGREDKVEWKKAAANFVEAGDNPASCLPLFFLDNADLAILFNNCLFYIGQAIAIDL